MNIIEELKELERKNIFVQHAFMGLGSDEWGFVYEITYLPKEFENAKRRIGHMVEKESFMGAGNSYVGAWDTIEEALMEGIKYAKDKIIKLV
jgi:hypothetical protein